jgi:MOSC domain-containing protein YiiM
MTAPVERPAARAAAAALGTVEGIFVAPAASVPMQALQTVRAIVGRGLEGDRYAEGIGFYSPRPASGRHVTLIDAAAVEALEAELGLQLAPGETRRNLVTRGVDLPALIGTRFTIGEALCEAVRDCPPCEHLEQVTAKTGILKALLGTGGIRAEVLQEGLIRLGDSIRPAD